MLLSSITLALRQQFVGLAAYGPALSLEFTSPTQTLDPRITFTRTSNATVTDSTGTLVYAPHNLLTFSESFDNAVWNKARSSITANTIVAPDGTLTGDKLVEDTATGTHHTSFTLSATAAVNTFSVYAKAGERSRLELRFVGGTDGRAAGFDLSTGTVFPETTPGTQASNPQITPVGNGWYRCSIDSSGTGDTAVFIYLNNGASFSYTGDGTSGLFIWGAQLNVGSLQPYYSTTVKNLLGFTQEFDNAGWTKSNATVSANVAVDPQGFMTADKLVANTSNTSHYAFQSVAVVSGTTYTFSVNAKAGEYSRMSIGRGTATGGLPTSGAGWYIDLSTGAIVGTPSWTVSVQPAGSGYFRVSGTFTATATSAGDGPAIYLQDNTGASFAGDGTSGIFIWGAQLSDSASLDPYVYNPGAAPASTAYFGPRFDYDPVTLAPKGLLIEEQRTNGIRNNTGVGAVAGTPGTAPTNWVIGSVGLTQQIVGIGVENGIAYIDIRLFGTTAGQFGQIYFDVLNAVSASAAQQWTNSAYLRLVAGSFTNISAQGLANYHYNASSALISVTAPSTSVTGTLTRQAMTSTTPANTAFVRAGFFFNGQNASGDAVDFTLRIGLPQLEQGAFATSPILTTTAAATRAADVAVMTGANFSNWYNQAAGSPYFEGATYSTTNTSCGISIDDNTVNNRIQLRRGLTGPTSQLRMVSSGGAIDVFNNSGTTLGVNKIAAGATASDQATASNGSLFTGITSITPMPTVTQMQIGNGPGSTIWNGHIRRIAYFPRRLSNAELQGITS